MSHTEFRPYATSFPGLSLSLMLMSKSKKTLETSLDLTPLFKTSIDRRVKQASCFEWGLFINFDALILFKRSMAEKVICCAQTCSFLDCNFSFCTDFLRLLMTFKGKKRINKNHSKQLKQFLLFFLIFFGLKD